MDYATFIEEIIKLLREKLDGCEIICRQIPKNNGIVLDGITIWNGDAIAPTIYLNPYYDSYLNGHSIEKIVNDIQRIYRTVPASKSFRVIDGFEKFANVKDHIIFRLINTKANELELRDIPHVNHLDLSMIFVISFPNSDDKNPEGAESGDAHFSAVIHNEWMETWGVDTDALRECAMKNTPKMFPAEVINLNDLMRNIAKSGMGAFEDPEEADAMLEDADPLYILSNSQRLYGAACICYENVLANFAENIEADRLLVIPSSVHEVLLALDFPSSSCTYFSGLVQEVNMNDVLPEERLSNNVYLFDRSTGKLSLASDNRKNIADSFS